MIRYALNCDKGHSFDSWFQSADAFDKLLAAGMVSCAVCGGTEVTKGLMAPRLSQSRDDTPDRPLSAPASPAEQALAELRRKIEENSDYVGDNFADEARRIHSGDAPERVIHGEARLDEARALIEEGVPIAPLPFMSGRKTN
ncbi:DUF1178 family protein [Actibacterium sp. XHP0104]|uniref:DUF1178 family protein n=1 Tax=Actibacterium sp. XHP0104 TaxID=2984335 RepID=UPI0021E8215D|nr:DUF1178 family protein [Actibacterium sp. XHP0104]MCV2880564.1 DUF1178 family protein [Actibacterium sp. XHP0104]